MTLKTTPGSPSLRLRQFVAAAIALTMTCGALAADYLVVVPVKGRTAAAPQPAISVTLNPAALPGGLTGEPYDGFDFNTALQVTGDADFKSSGVTWSIVEGALPEGLALSADGRLAGTPTQAGNTTFSVRASYRTKTGQHAYQVVVGTLTVALAAAALPNAPVGANYSYDFAPRVSVTGDPAYDASKMSWSAVGALPAGLALSSSGLLSGKPAQLGDEGASFSLKAAYRTKSGQQTYTLYPSDPLYGNVTLLMHMDGVTGFTDAKGHAFTAVGNPRISTSDSKYGGASAYFDGNAYLKTAYSPSFAFIGDFTVELWAKIAAHGSYGGLIAAAQSTSWTGWQIIFDQTSNKIRFEGGAPNIAMVSANDLPLNTWAHIALVRQGMATNNVRLYINGVLEASTTFTGTLDNGGQPLYIGVERTTGFFVAGYIDDVRITANAARYTGNFTPPGGSHPTR
ncbi:LamG domain-containing protein [Burkholderia ubonensis]|uniref:LamG domain-containing protein n=1 Tax=Burkholderia ubonensis TaxID=101571 RepID=UPI000757802F|nr:LamG domain-containing protein [Burkholderia ubonensis]KVP75567.1 hypothetical protein WJ93_09415 [Burkholderia ubonensis]KVZ93078.1 hypothetical protein WL25_19280 [Burkholderia ubonensis]